MLRGQFDVRDVLDENAQARGGGERRDHRRGRRQDERAGATEITSTAMTLFKSRVKAQTSAPITSTSGV